MRVGVLDASPPSWRELGRAPQRFPVEAEVLVDERRRQNGRVGTNQLPAKVGLDVVQRRCREQRTERFEEVRLGDVDRLERRRADATEVRGPVEGRRQSLELVWRHAVVDPRRIPSRHVVERRFRQRRLHAHHGLRRRGRGKVLGAKEPSERRDVFHIPGANGDRARIVPEVVIAIREAKSSLVGDGDHGLRVPEIGFGAEAEECGDADAVKAGEEAGQVCHMAERSNGSEVLLERRGSPPLDPRLVHAGRVVVADLFRGGLAARCRHLEHAAQYLVVTLLQLVEAAPARAIGRKRIPREPGAAGKLEKVSARIDGAVHRGEVEPRLAGRGRSGRTRRVLLRRESGQKGWEGGQRHRDEAEKNHERRA